MTTQISTDAVRYAYEQGFFPMGDEEGRIDWYVPTRRALLPIAGIHVSHSLRRTLNRADFEIRFDTAFEQVIRSCLRPTHNWITEEIIEVYTQIHRQGWAHCAEAWQDGVLVGGVYGVAVGACFSAESMFHRATDASKVALKAMVDRCRQLGFQIFDAQIQNPHLASLGAFEISAFEYRRLLSAALNSSTAWS